MYTSTTLVIGLTIALVPLDDKQKSGPVCDERIDYRLAVNMVTHDRTNVSNSIE